ncbi:tetratricopeptide repeat protein [Helicobacter trogontum]|uniref:Tetratricopeptide repeat protein n=1 Tax=Helicobacter trogontum TaxID=50960 RepID=A0A4U8S9U7_9HELI|nr:tetratricopeptide repeat protein [Helicobacter trogontum]TLD82607.1 tetratricopeptide repeat protein [Helicobacter trogontum]
MKLKRSVLVFASSFMLLYAEPSAFELQSGATKKDMQDLKDIADFTRSVIGDFQNKIVNLEQAVDGLKTVYEGMSVTSRQDSIAIKNQIEKIQNIQDIVNSYQMSQKSQAELVKNLKAQVEANTKNIEQINQKIDKLSEAFLQANDEIIKQIQVLSEQALALQNNIQGIQNQPIIDSMQVNGSASKQTYNFSPDNDKNLREAKNLLRKKQNEEAKAYFEYLIDQRFAVAESSYYIGEIYYARKEYNKALPYYKTSASLDSKANYMPILLWHTAWSFKYLNDPDNYIKFLQTLVALFPESEQGRKAQDILSK